MLFENFFCYRDMFPFLTVLVTSCLYLLIFLLFCHFQSDKDEKKIEKY